ncbi:hypothetical protein YTPLAS18_29130 [Nitrospira sp.]|nr:hypothetical protein YTPLAS18_29130 [Nitrospira sp.]
MNAASVRRFSRMMVVLSMCLVTSACNTTKATSDTIAKFFSSTTPGEIFTEDGVLAEDQKVNFFVGVGFDSLQQDIARGQGEYLVSLERLLGITPNHHAEFANFAQQHYETLFASDLSIDRTAHLSTVAMLEEELSKDGRLAKWRMD